MAALTHPHWEATPPLVRGVLARIGKTVSLAPFYLAGGTALALRRGYRISQDLYFITREKSLDSLFQQADQKFAGDRYFLIRSLEALVDFDIADKQAEPELLARVTWDQVKAFFTAEARRLGHLWLQDF